MPRVFPPNSRYANSEARTYVSPEGREVPYVAARVIPQPERHVPLALHRVDEPARPDTLADRHYGDSEQYWRICDANRVSWPPDLAQDSEAVVVIPLPLEVSDRGDT